MGKSKKPTEVSSITQHCITHQGGLSVITQYIAYPAGGRDLPSMKQFINSQKVTLLQETEA